MATAATLMAMEEQLAHHSALPLRATLSSVMLYHGIEKLRPKGLEETTHVFEKLGITPARPWALATGWTEVGIGVLSLLGIGTRVAALAVLVTQTVAIAKVHGPNGFDSRQGGYEFNLSLIATALGLLLGGPGDVSVHHAVASRDARWTPPWRRREVNRRRGLVSLLTA